MKKPYISPSIFCMNVDMPMLIMASVKIDSNDTDSPTLHEDEDWNSGNAFDEAF